MKIDVDKLKDRFFNKLDLVFFQKEGINRIIKIIDELSEEEITYNYTAENSKSSYFGIDFGKGEIKSVVTEKHLKPCYLSDGTEETGKRIIEELMKVEGVKNVKDFNGENINANKKGYFYFEYKNQINHCNKIPEGYVLTELPKEIKELTFPRRMTCWNENENFSFNRIVISNHNNLFQALGDDYEDEFVKGEDVDVQQWKNAIEIEVEQPKEEAKEEIIKQLRCTIKQLENALEDEISKNRKIKGYVNSL